MKTKILLAGMCLSLAACESMDLVPKSQGNTESWYTSETELRLASNDFYILGYWQEPLSSSEQWSDNTPYRQTMKYMLCGSNHSNLLPAPTQCSKIFTRQRVL